MLSAPSSETESSFFLDFWCRRDYDGLTVRQFWRAHMPTAFVLFKTEPSSERDVFLALSNMDSIVETHALYGEYDLVARVHAEDGRNLTKLLMQNLRMISGVKATETLIVVDY